METSNQVTITADEENAAEEFWAAVRTDDNCPECLKDLADSAPYVEVSKEDAAAAEEWCENAPGYADGPEHARTAVIFN